jgi:hypothetical protein
MTLHNLLIDKRIVQRNIEQGKLDAGEYQRVLDALPDLSDKVWRKPAAPAAEEAHAAPQHAEAAPAPAPAASESEAAPASAPRSDVTSAFDASL